MGKSALRDSGSTRHWRKIRERILRRDQYTCNYCGQEADTVDHVIPRRLGGLDTDDNLVACVLIASKYSLSYLTPMPGTTTIS